MERAQALEPRVTEYLRALFRELERLWPTSSVMSHAIAWDDETQALILLMHPGDIAGDPVATAETRVARGRLDFEKPDAGNSLITFKS